MEKTIKDLDIYISDGNYSSKYPRSEEFVDDGVPFIRGNNMVDGDITDDEMYHITPEKHAILLKGHVKAGDVLITTRGNIGQVAIVPDRHEDSNINAQIVLLRTNPESLYNRYLLWALQSQRANEQYLALQTGTALKQLPVGKLEKLSIQVADINKQHEIADVLDKTYGVIKSRRNELRLLDDLIKARFVEMFVGKDYPVLKWNDVFKTTTGKLDSNAAVENGEYPFFTCSKEILRIDNFAFDQEALLLAGNNAAGKYDVKYYNGKFNAYQRTYVLGLKGDWSYQLFKSQLEDKLVYLQQQSLGGLTKYLTMKILGELEFIIPPMEKQIEFADFVKQTDKSKSVVQKALDEAQLLFDSLMQQYFG